MKRILSMALALVLALGLAVPALAVESKDAVDLLEDLGLAVPISDEILMGEESDDFAAYEAAHPEEFENMDVDALIADWGYEDMTAQEAFLDDYSYYGGSVEDVVKQVYIDKREAVEFQRQEAELYKEAYPKLWESFDVDAYFGELQEKWGWEDKTEYMARWSILTDEEFAEMLFVTYVDHTKWDNWGEPQGEPTLTLMVNGVASDVAVTAVDGVSYVDADGLRAILGDKAVAADMTGPVSVRAAAQAAGWDVAWYDGGWRGVDQEIQLWDKAAFEAELAQEFGPFNDFMAKVAKINMAKIFSETPISGHETVEVNLTRFSTLDGNRDYKLKFAVDYVAQKGVMDVTITFDASQLLQLYAPSDLAAWGEEGGFTVAQLTALLKAGTAELILDYNENAMAYNVPLLALMDEEQAGWQVIYSGTSRVLPDMKEWEDISFVSAAYAKMTTVADYLGAEQALSGYQSDLGIYTLFLGKDRFTTKNGKATYSLTARDVNRGLSAIRAKAFEEEDGQHSFFKNCELTWSIDDSGNTAMELRLRPDMEGIAAFAGLDEPGIGVASGLRLLLPFFDMDLTASGSGNQSHSTSQMKVHWNNVGTLEMKTQTTAGKAAKAPRQVEEVSPAPALPAEADVVDPGFNFGVIGGSDGPTAIMVTHS